MERVRPGRVPVAAIAFLLCVVAVELTARTHTEWFADLASWQWESKRALLDTGRLDGDVAIFGSSVLFHGLDPMPARAGSAAKGGVVNLALNGMMIQHQTQFLRNRLASGRPPSIVVLEFRGVTIERDTWVSGPYFRLWASFPEFAESRFFYGNAPLGLTFMANRVFQTFRYREAIDNWLFESARVFRVSPATRDRNRATAAEIRDHGGMAAATFETQTMASYSGSTRARPWTVDAAGELWLYRFLDLAAAGHVQVVLLLPPSPPYLTEEQGPEGFKARFSAYVARLRDRYPSLGLEVMEPTGYGLEDFADDRHFSASGREKLTADFATWIEAYLERHAATTARR